MNTKKKSVMFVCIHNSARSQMAEAYFNHFCNEHFEAESSGLEPGVLNPLAVTVLQEEGIDISQKPTKSVFDHVKSGKLFAYVVTVCDETSAERCPIFAGVTTRVHWSFPDPSALQGSDEEKQAKTREIRDLIKAKVKEFCAEIGALK